MFTSYIPIIKLKQEIIMYLWQKITENEVKTNMKDKIPSPRQYINIATHEVRNPI